MKYKCRIVRKDGSVCDYGTDSRHGYAGHTKGHVNRGELVKGGLKVEEIVVKPEGLVDPTKVADALLGRVVEVLKGYDTLVEEVGELRGCKTRASELEKQLDRERREKERVVKIHNEQVKRGQVTSGEELLRLAKLR